MKKMFAVTVLGVMLASTAMADKKKTAKGDVRAPASGQCTSGSIRALQESAMNCSSGRWVATGNNFNASFCCVEVDDNDNGGPQAR